MGAGTAVGAEEASAEGNGSEVHIWRLCREKRERN